MIYFNMVLNTTKFKETEIGTIPEEWDVFSLGDLILKANTGLDAIKRAPIVFIDTGVKCLRIQDVSQKKDYNSWGFCNVTEKNYNNFNLKKNDILIARTGETVGVNIFIKNDLRSVYNNGLIRLKINKIKIIPDYLHHYLRSSLFEKFIDSIAFGTSTQPNIQINALLSFKIVLPGYEEQKQIAEILSSLDDKIELNRQINANLEKIASSLFKHWFVDFEFPDKNNKPYKSSGGKMIDSELGEIPEGWKTCKLEEVLEALESGKRPKGGAQDFGVPSIGAENINGLGYYNFSSTKYVNEDYYNKMNNGKVKDYDIMLYKDGAYIGKKTMFGLGFPFDNCCINEHVFILRTNNKINQFYLYFYLNQNEITEKIKHLNTNSAQPGINKESLINFKILLPNNDFVDHYKIITQPLIDLILKNSLQNKQLSELRDSLLPRLMSGKIRVKI